MIKFRTQAEQDKHIADNLEDARKCFESGDAWGLARAIAICGQYKVIMPRWVASAYMDKFEDVHYGRERVLTLGSPYRKDAKIAAVAKQMNAGWEVYRAVTKRIEDYPQDGKKGAYDSVAQDMGIGKNVVARYYNAALRAITQKHKNISKQGEPAG